MELSSEPQSSPRGWGAREWIAATILLAVAVLYLSTARGYLTYDGDMATYLGLGASLSRGDGYIFNGTLHTKYPPGLPVLLAPLFRAGIGSVHNAQMLIVCVSIASLLVTYLYLVGRDATRPLLICLVIAISPAFYDVSTSRVYADVPYLFCSIAVLAWAERLAARPTGSDGRPSLAAVAALCVVAAVAFRTAAVSLVAALVVAAVHIGVFRRGTGCRATATALAAVSAAGLGASSLWSWYVARFTNSEFIGQSTTPYFRLLRLSNPHQPDLGEATLLQIVGRFPSGVLRQIAHAAEMLTGVAWLQASWTSPLVLATLTLVGWGLAREMRRPQPLAGWYLLTYCALFALWPFDEGRRFLVPVAPLIFLFAFEGLRSAHSWVAGQDRARLGVACAIMGALLLLMTFLALPSSWSAAPRQSVAAALVWSLLSGGGIAVWFTARARRPRVSDRVLSVRSILSLWVFVYALLCTPQLLSQIAANRPSAAGAQGKAVVGLAAAWISANTAVTDVVMCEELADLHYNTGRHVVQLPETIDARTLRSALERLRPRYVVINEPLPNPYVLPTEPDRLNVMQALGVGSWSLAASYAGGRIYRFEPVDLR